MSKFINKYAIASYYILSLILGAGITYLVVQRVLPAGLILLAATAASISGIIITGIADGRDGLKLLFGRLLIWRVGIGWWLFAFLFLAVAVLVGLLLNPFFGGETADFSNMQPLYQIVPMFILFIITAGLGEELGWTGFLTPRLQHATAPWSPASSEVYCGASGISLCSSSPGSTTPHWLISLTLVGHHKRAS